MWGVPPFPFPNKYTYTHTHAHTRARTYTRTPTHTRHLKLKASQHPSYIKNTYDFIDRIKYIPIPPNALLITLDVESMYTNILHEKGLESITERFKSSYLDENISRNYYNCASIVMTLNLMASGFFQISGQQWVQSGHHIMHISIYMAYFEEKAFRKMSN